MQTDMPEPSKIQRYLVAMTHVLFGRGDGSKFYQYRVAAAYGVIVVGASYSAARYFWSPLPWWVDLSDGALFLVILVLPILGGRADLRAERAAKGDR